MNISEYRKSLLYRKSQGNVCREEYLNKIKSITNELVNVSDFLSLEETDLIINSLKNKKIISSNEVEIYSCQDLASFIKEKVTGVSYYLLMDEKWKFCSAYKIDRNLDYNQDYHFNDLYSDEIRIIACDLSFQIQIDYDCYNIECSHVIYK
ncbi:hypothetical protein QPK13_06705 [Photorhabdus tasmaniensis]